MTSDAHTAAAAPTPKGTRSEWLPWLIAALLAANFLAGVFPFSPVEGDEQGIINGLREMVRGATEYYGLRYDYEFQAGTYQIVLALHRIVGGEVATAYFALSAVAAAGFILLSARLIAELAEVRWAWALSLALLCQEMTTAGFYANTSTVGGCWGLIALCLVLKDAPWRWIAAGGCIALAGWCRIDSLMLAPAVLAIGARRLGWRVAIVRTVEAAAISLVGLTALLRAAGMNWTQVWQHFTDLRDTVGVLGYGYTLANLHYETSMALTVAAAAGLARSIGRREWFPAALMLSVALPGAYVHGDYLASPKYLYFLAPVLATCAAVALREVLPAWRQAGWGTGRALALVALAALGAEYFTALRTSTAEFRRFTPEPTALTLATVHAHGKPVSWVVGPGEVVPNADGFRVRMGYGFAPQVWRREKEAALAELARWRGLLGQPREFAVLTSTYVANQCAIGDLRQNGYERVEAVPYPGNPVHHADLWVRGAERCWLVWVNHSPDDVAVFTSYAERFGRMPIYFFNDLGALAADRLFAGSGTKWRLLSPRADGIFALYERQ